MAETSKYTTDIVRAGLQKRYRREARFRRMGLAAIIAGLVFLSLLFTSIVGNGYTAFWQTYIQLEVHLDASVIDPDATGDRAVIAGADYGGLVKRSLRDMFPEVTGRRDKRTLYGIVSSGASFDLRDFVTANPDRIGKTIQLWVPADDDVDMLMKGHFDRDKPEAERRIKDNQIVWIDKLVEQGRVESRFNTTFFTAGDSREPELAGIWGAAVGSFWTMLVTFALAFPVGVFAAIYLEEFAPKNRFTDFVEVNINNLAAVPSIVFGLLGLAVFLGFFGVPRSSPLAGGIVLALMTLPTIIIASRASIRAVPPSIRDAALGLGASKLQTSFHHVLPLAMPGILTGTIIGMAQALGETAPLLLVGMNGMVAFIVEIPSGITDSATVLPVQIFRWSDFPERAFEARTAAAICVLLLFLVLMNGLAVFLRKRFERRW